MTWRPSTRRTDPTDGLTMAQRFALCDAANGLLGRFGDQWRRQTCAHFQHTPDTVAALAARGLLEFLADDIAQTTYRGRRAAMQIRRRRQAVAQWEGMKCHQ